MTRDAAAVQRWLASAALLAELTDDDRRFLAEHADWASADAGHRLHAEGEDPAGLWFLVEGRVAIGDAEGPFDGVVRQLVSTPGYPIGWDGMVWPRRHRWHAVTANRCRLLHVGRVDLDARTAADPAFAARLTHIAMWLAGEQLRRQRTRLIARRYDDEVDAVAAMIVDHADELRVTSPLHRIPGYLRSRPTLGDAFRALEALRKGDDLAERRIARLALEMLAGVRAELRVYRDLQHVYEAVARAPADQDPEEVRAAAARALIDLFQHTDYRILGREHLPDKPGSIVILNHLASHPDNTLPNGFTVILDTHFVASMILYRKYGRAPVRVVRDSHWDEAGHQQYYQRLGYVMVPSSEREPVSEERRAARWERFEQEAGDVLGHGLDLVVCPEGRPGPTEGSPRRFASGIFRVAADLEPEPRIVPVALANFDRQLRRAVLSAVISEPFRMSDVVDDPSDRAQVRRFLDDQLVPRYRAWVAEAAAAT